jgi:hypothetical protein
MLRNVRKHKQERTLEILCRLSATSFTVLFSYSFIGHYMFRPNWPSSGVQVVLRKDSAARCNAVFFPPIVVASGYFGYVCCTWSLLVLFGFVGCGCLECPR